MDKDTDKVEEASVIALRQYLLRCPRIKPIINDNDKTPFWDGDLYVYKNDDQKGNVKDNFHGRVSIQVKGRSDNTTYFKISNAEANAYYNDGGCLFFKVLVNEDLSSTILYFLLSRTVLKKHLQQSDVDIKFQLEEVPNNPLDFQQNVYDFVTLRNGENVEKSSPKEIAKLFEEFEKIRENLNKIEDKEVSYELESYLDSIKKLNVDDTIGWRDKFIYYSRKAIDLVINHLKEYDLVNLLLNLGVYLYNQKIYKYVEDYYMKSLNEYRNRAKDDPNRYNGYVALALNNIALLHAGDNRLNEAKQEYREAIEILVNLGEKKSIFLYELYASVLKNRASMYHLLNLFSEAEKDYKEALDVFKTLSGKNPNKYLWYVGITINSIADLYNDYQNLKEAESRYLEALDFFRVSAKRNPNVIESVAMTLCNLATLHSKTRQDITAELEYKEALDIYRNLIVVNANAITPELATTLHNLAILHKAMKKYAESEVEFNECLEIRRSLAKNNPDRYSGDLADTLNSFANFYDETKNHSNAEKYYFEALDIYIKLVKDNPDVYSNKLAGTLYNVGLLYVHINKYTEAEKYLKDALEIFRGQAKANSNKYYGYMAMILHNLANLHSYCNRLEDAEKDLKEALGIHRELAATNRDAYIGNIAATLNNLAALHFSLKKMKEAEQEYLLVLEIDRERASFNRDAYIGDVAMTLFNLTIILLHDKSRLNEAKDTAKEALGIYKELTKKNPQIWNRHVEDTQRILDEIDQRLSNPLHGNN